MEIRPNYFLLTFLYLLFYSNVANAQTCENSDFEYGNFTNWNGFTGVCCGGLIATPGIVSGRHTIITSSTLDPNTNNIIPTMPPIGGGAYSVRLGNDNVGSEAESLKRSFTVSSANQLFIYQYALVLQDPEGHPPIDKPKFEVRIFDENGAIINPYECGYYQVTAGPETNTWGQYNDVRYKDWSTVGIDLSAYLGTVITIEFTVQDCGWGGHYGYAYLDATCGFLDIEVIGFCEGSTTVTLIAPDGFDQYFWPHSSETTQVVTIPTPNVGDSVIVEVTNQSGCATSILHIFEELPLIDAIAGNDTLMCVGQQVDLWSGGAGANGNYNWYANGIPYSTEQNITVSPLQTTNYELIVSNANGCFSPDSSANVLVEVNDTLFFQLANDTMICLGDNFTINGPTGNFNYLWFTINDDTLSLNQSITVAPLDSTTYYLQISNSTCTFTDSLVLAVNNAATLADTIISDFCIGDSLLQISGPLDYTQYLWSNGSNTMNTEINPYVETILQLNLLSPYGCLDSVIYITNETNPPIPVISSFDDTLCKGQNSILFVSSSGSDYVWSSIPSGFNGNGTSIIVNPDMSISYVVQAISSIGCTDMNSYDTVSIIVDTTAFFELGPNVEICQGQSTTLTGPSSMLIYDWYTDGNSFSSDISIFVSPQFSQYYYLTTYSQSCSFSDYVNVLVIPVTNFDIDVITCSDNSQVLLTAPSGYSSVFWPQFNNNNISNTLQNPTDNQATTVYVTNANTCVDTCQLIINLLEPSNINPLLDETICYGDALSILATSSYSFDEYEWTSIPSGTNFQGNPLTTSPLSTTSYVVTLSNQYDCVANPSTDTMIVTVTDDQVIPPLDPLSACYGEALSISSPTTTGSFTWSYLTQQSNNTTFNFAAFQTGNISLTVVNGPCSDSQLIPVTVFNPQVYTIQSSDSEICIGEFSNLYLNPTNFSSVNWFANGNLIGTSNSISVAPETSTYYSATITDINSCVFDTTIQITVNQLPYVNLGPDQIICAKTSAVLLSAASPQTASYSWSTLETSPAITVTTTGTYELTVVNNNCISTDEVYIEFNPYSFMGQIPNVITANGDLINDEFSYESLNIKDFHLIIFNRWGNKIFESEIYNQFWDGKSKNNTVEEGVYFYKLTYRLACEEELKELHGNITVSN